MRPAPNETIDRVVCQVPFLLGAEGHPALAAATEPAGLATALDRATGACWNAPPAAVFDTGAEPTPDLVLQQYEREYAGELSRHVPRRVLVSEIDPRTVAAAVAVEWAEWKPARASIDLWSLGVGIVTVVYAVEARTADWETLRDGLDRERSSLRTAVGGVAAATGRAAATALGVPPASVWGQPLWMHVVVLVEAPDGTAEADLDAIASLVVYGGPRVGLEPTLSGAVVRLRLDTCAVFVREHRAVGVAMARMTAAHTAVWAAAAGYDRVLLDALTTPVARQSTSLAALERRADELLDLYQRVHAFRTQVDSMPLHLGWPDMPLWRAVAEQWGLERELDGLIARFDALDHLHTHLLEGVGGRRARRLSAFVLVFTVASVVTFGITLVDFSQRRLESARALNVAILATLVGLALVVGGIAFALARRDRR